MFQRDSNRGPSRARKRARTQVRGDFPKASAALRPADTAVLSVKQLRGSRRPGRRPLRVGRPPRASFGFRFARNPFASDRSLKCGANRRPQVLDIRRIPGSTGDRTVPLGLNSQRRVALRVETHRPIAQATRINRTFLSAPPIRSPDAHHRELCLGRSQQHDESSAHVHVPFT